MDIYTRTGDKGQTSLYDGVRVSKSDIRVESYGTIDELGALLGISTHYTDNEELKKELIKLQNKLFVVSENLATEDPGKVKHFITDDDVLYLEEKVDQYMNLAGPFTGFTVQGTTKSAAFLHLARTVCRRAERRIIALSGQGEVDEHVLQFVNRLADVLYAFAVAEEGEPIKADFEGSLRD